MTSQERESAMAPIVTEVTRCACRRSIRARMAQRATEKVVRASIANWQPGYRDMSQEAVETDLTARVEKYGFGPVVTFVLFAALSAVIKVIVTELIYWWLERRQERGELLCSLRG